MKKQRVIIHNDRNEKLVGYLYKKTTKALLIICHGTEPANGYPRVEEVFEIYSGSGASIFSFDFSGHGESEGKKNLSLRRRVNEIRKVIDYFFNDYDQIILYGISLGGVSVALYAPTDKRVAKLITINGFFSFDPRQFSFRQALAMGIFIALNPRIWPEIYFMSRNFDAKKITIPTLVVYGEKDLNVNPRQSINFYNNLRIDKKLFPIKDGDHTLMGPEMPSASLVVQFWIKEQIK